MELDLASCGVDNAAYPSLVVCVRVFGLRLRGLLLMAASPSTLLYPTVL